MPSFQLVYMQNRENKLEFQLLYWQAHFLWRHIAYNVLYKYQDQNAFYVSSNCLKVISSHVYMLYFTRVILERLHFRLYIFPETNRTIPVCFYSVIHLI